MPDFHNILNSFSWKDISNEIRNKTEKDVQRVLKKDTRDLRDFMTLLSPAAEVYLEELAQLSKQLTTRRFGNTVQLYVPVYLSNECQNICTYCGFSYTNRIKRITLNESQIRNEINEVKGMGFDHVLLVTGEANRTVGVDYLEKAIELVSPMVSNVSIEVQPLEESEYRRLINKGLNSVLVYQETYNRSEYKKHHPKGKKSNFGYRLDTPERLGRSGVHKIGLGVLLGLEDWRTDSFFCGLHLNYMESKFWKTRYSISFPRLRPCAGGVELKSDMTDAQLLQLICAYRIFNPEVELSLSTREHQVFRDNVLGLGITSMSAGSKTEPGGYSLRQPELEQFEIDDNRSPKEVANAIEGKGYEPVWKDWDPVLQQS